jgi:uncharacterized protein YeaO (DUF488 family)
VLRLKRVYDPVEPDDGRRILVDRLWPRGLTREAAALDAWIKDIAPSDQLRRRFGHDPQNWEEFRSSYIEELSAHGDLISRLRLESSQATLTLLYAAKDTRHNNAVILKSIIESD